MNQNPILPILLVLTLTVSAPAAVADDIDERTLGAADHGLAAAGAALEDTNDLAGDASEGIDALEESAWDGADILAGAAGNDEAAEDLQAIIDGFDPAAPDTAFVGGIAGYAVTEANKRVAASVGEANAFVGSTIGSVNGVVAGVFGGVNGAVGGATGAANQITSDSIGIANKWAATGIGIGNKAIAETTPVVNEAVADSVTAANGAAAAATSAANNALASAFGSVNTAAAGVVRTTNGAAADSVASATRAVRDNSPNKYVGQGASLGQDMVHGYDGDASNIARELAEIALGASQGQSASGDDLEALPSGEVRMSAGQSSGPPLQPRFNSGASCPVGQYRWQAVDTANRKGQGCALFQASTSAKTPIVLSGRNLADGSIVLTRPDAAGIVTLQVERTYSLAGLRIEVGKQVFEYQYVDSNGKWANQPRTLTATLDGVMINGVLNLLGDVSIDTTVDVRLVASGTSAATLRMFAIDDKYAKSWPQYNAIELGRLQSFDKEIAQALPPVIDIRTVFDGSKYQGEITVDVAELGSGVPALFKPKGPSDPFVLDRIFPGTLVDLDYNVGTYDSYMAVRGDIVSPYPIDKMVLPVGDQILTIHGLKELRDLDLTLNKGTHMVGDCDRALLTSLKQLCVKGDVRWPGLEIVMDDPPLEITNIPQGDLEIIMGPGSYARIDTSAVPGTSDLGATIRVENQFGLDRLTLEQVTDVTLQWGDALEDVSIDARFATSVGSRVLIESEGLTLDGKNVERVSKGNPRVYSSAKILFQWPDTSRVRSLVMTGEVAGNQVTLTASEVDSLGLHPGGDGYLFMLSNVRLDRPDGFIRFHGAGEIDGKDTDLWLDVDRTGWRDNYHLRFDAVMEGAGGWPRDHDWPNPGDAGSYSAYNPKAREWVDLMKVKTLRD